MKIEGLALTVNPAGTSFSLAYKKPEKIGEHWVLTDQKPIKFIGRTRMTGEQIAQKVMEKLTEVVGPECIPHL